jgi:drug/metabolite transporter (DMT)-like permease
VGAFLLFGERLSALQLTGGLLVILAIVVVQYSEARTGTLPPVDPGMPPSLP